jgi:hypothetical protein
MLSAVDVSCLWWTEGCGDLIFAFVKCRFVRGCWATAVGDVWLIVADKFTDGDARGRSTSVEVAFCILRGISTKGTSSGGLIVLMLWQFAMNSHGPRDFSTVCLPESMCRLV